jgi:hypothetical protein
MKAHIRERLEIARANAGAPAVVRVATTDPIIERHYTFTELASLWSLSYETTRRLFVNEPGVVSFGDAYRVPESVVRRVYTRLANQ